MVGRLNWSDFSQFVSANIVDDTQVDVEKNGRFVLTHKKLGAHEGEGSLGFVTTPDFNVLIADCAFEAPRVYECLDAGLTRFHFNLDVSLETSWRDMLIHDIITHPAGMFVAPGDYVLTDRVPKGERQRFVTVACRPAWLSDFFGVDIARFSPADNDDEQSPFLHRPFAFRPQMKEAANSIIQRSQANRLNGAHVTVNCQSLVLSALETLLAPRDKQAEIKPGDIASINKAREILETNFANPPGVDRLCRLIGINRTKLHSGFNRVHGVTIGQFIELQRMSRARQLLADTDMDVAHIAFDVGYSHPSSFSARFKAHAGVTPSEFRSGTRR